MLTQEVLKREMEYLGGQLFWRKPAQGRRLSGRAGSVDKEGYVRIKLLGQDYMAHRLVWMYFHGVLPQGQLDHENRRPADNRIENLRESNTRDNNLNKDQSERALPYNIYGHHGKYRVDILYKGTRYKSKTLPTVEEALEAREALLLEAGLGQ